MGVLAPGAKEEVIRQEDVYKRQVSHSLFYKALDEKAVYRAADLAEDQQYIRDHLKEQGLVAFVADASILPRESGV